VLVRIIVNHTPSAAGAVSVRPVQLYNSLTRRKEELPPPPGPIGIYVCGPTVYQRIHIGNARPYVVFLWLKRWLELHGYDVKLVENITDVNDKIYDAAAKQGIPSAQLAEQTTRWYVDDTAALGLGRPDVEPLATETIPEIVALIEELVERDLAYEAGGDVYFRVARFPEYGTLSGVQLEDMVAQDDVSDLKEDPRDFALWKASKEGEDTSWDSPWGRGRPGWHIECSAMAEKHLGAEFELHGGGLDLRFPHHENELAQSRGAGRPFARRWTHNGLLRLDEEKMAKSVGNIVTLRDVLDTYGRDAILIYFLGGHYRGEIDYSDEAMQEASTVAADFRTAFRVAETRSAPGWEVFAAALDDDFNTPAALALLHEWRAAGQVDLLEQGLDVFGLAVERGTDQAPEEIQRLARERSEARERRDFERADELRTEIESHGWEVQDVADGFRLVPKS
jgi:cysteinyl-tRNA synthetase